jgi:hypothetical protein
MQLPSLPVRNLLAAALISLASPAATQTLESLEALVADWLGAGHADHHSRSFTYWNEAGEVPVACAACHSEPGFIDWLGADGSTAGVVDHPAAINAPIGCAACHTAAAHALDAVTFPSGETLDDLGPNAVCTVCHAGRQSGDAVAAAVGGHDPDTVMPEQGFINIHYGAAAAVMQGAGVRGGYQYPGRSYAGRFDHVPSANTCTACHDAHSTRVEVEGCLTCHRGVEDIRAIRTRHGDFDGDGDATGGIHAEIRGLHGQLYAAIRAYAADVSGAPIAYSAAGFPYFFNDPEGTGEIAAEQAVAANRYQNWTPRLLQAAYNYQAVAKDPGGYVHNPTYLLQLLYDSLDSLSERVTVDMGRLSRP